MLSKSLYGFGNNTNVNGNVATTLNGVFADFIAPKIENLTIKLNDEEDEEFKIEETKTKKQKKYSLVGPQEIDPLQGKISISSPVGKVLIGKKQGDTVKVSVPKGTLEYLIVEVTYP